MYYIIQENVFQDPRYDQIFKVLEELDLPYEKVQFQPNSVVFEYETDRKDIFVYGSVKLAKITSKHNWFPGSFYGNNHEFEKYSLGYGSNTLNSGSYITEFSSDFEWVDGQSLFIKPSKDAKVFTGKVFSEPEWKDFVYETLNGGENKRVNAKSPIQVAKAQKILKEARVWIVNNQVVSSSYYLFHGNTEYEDSVAEEGLLFAKNMTDIYSVADAYVMDICLTYNGWKIVEVNCINSAGFYKANVKDIIIALEAHFK